MARKTCFFVAIPDQIKLVLIWALPSRRLTCAVWREPNTKYQLAHPSIREQCFYQFDFLAGRQLKYVLRVEFKIKVCLGLDELSMALSVYRDPHLIASFGIKRNGHVCDASSILVG